MNFNINADAALAELLAKPEGKRFELAKVKLSNYYDVGHSIFSDQNEAYGYSRYQVDHFLKHFKYIPFTRQEIERTQFAEEFYGYKKEDVQAFLDFYASAQPALDPKNRNRNAGKQHLTDTKMTPKS